LTRIGGRRWPRELAQQFVHPLALLLWAAAALGSTAQELLRRTPCSLLLVPRPADEPAAVASETISATATGA
jgi:hypothetical protein